MDGNYGWGVGTVVTVGGEREREEGEFINHFVIAACMCCL